MLGLGVLTLVLAGGVALDGQTDCPSAEAVALELRALVGDADAGATAHERVSLTRAGDALTLRLTGEDGRPLAERALPGHNCEELARAAAVLIAAWRTEVGATTPRLELPPPPPPKPPRPPLGFEVGVGFTASLAGASFAPGGTVFASLGPRRGRLLARLAVTGTGLRDLQVGTSTVGHARFTRAGLSAGPLVRFRPGRFLLDLFAEATAALVYVDAVGFPSNASAYDFDVGLGGGGRAALHAGPVAPFLSARVVGWLTAQSVRVNGPTGGTSGLPRFEVLLEAGIAFGKY